MSVRAGYGTFIDRQMVIGTHRLRPKRTVWQRRHFANVQLSDPWATYPGGDPISDDDQ